MKTLFKATSLILILSIFIISCDKIEPPYTNLNGGNGGTNDTIRKVLLEDFTGHTCTNCPSAHKLTSDLHQLYGDQLIIVAIHAGSFAKPRNAPYEADYRTAEGNSIFNFFNVQSTPIGMVNRIKQTNGGFLVEKGAFATEVSKQLDSLPEEPDLYIHLDPTFNATDSTLNLATETTFLNSLPAGKYNLCIMITEDDIISPQYNNDPSIGDVPEILDYEHKHMLRGMVSPDFGDEILDGSHKYASCSKRL
jgi:thiol-disulfide isomerase/thioredoxin